MKINIKLLSVLLAAPAISFSMKRDIPAWVAQADGLLEGLGNIEQALTNDVSLYQNLAKSLEDVIGDFDAIDTQRQGLVKAVQDKIEQLNNLLAQAQETAATVEQKDAYIKDLQDQLAALKDQTQKDIADLNNKVTQLTSDLDIAREGYTTLANLDIQRATDIINQLTSAKNSYQSMVDARTNFLTVLDRYSKRVADHIINEKQDFTNLTDSTK